MFAGYASLFALQRQVKQIVKISDDDNSSSFEFGVMIAMLYIGNLVFRLCNGYVFKSLKPLKRCLAGILLMISALTILTICDMLHKWYNITPSMLIIGLAYSFGGAGIGTFEPNMLEAISQFNTSEKRFASLGIPAGVGTITIGGFLLLSLNVPLYVVYITVILMLFLGSIGSSLYLSKHNKTIDPGYVKPLLIDNPYENKRSMSWYYISIFIDMLGVSLFSPGVMLYLLDHNSMTFLKVKRTQYFMIYGICTTLGGLFGRWIGFTLRKSYNPLLLVLVVIIGMVIDLALAIYNPIFGWLAGFLVLCGNALLYNQSWSYLGTKNTNKTGVTLYSKWLFVGDLGSTIGTIIMALIKSEYN
jgi:hypothetical protein